MMPQCLLRILMQLSICHCQCDIADNILETIHRLDLTIDHVQSFPPDYLARYKPKLASFYQDPVLYLGSEDANVQ